MLDKLVIKPLPDLDFETMSDEKFIQAVQEETIRIKQEMFLSSIVKTKELVSPIDESVFDDTGLDINISYPNNPDYIYETYLEPVDLDQECGIDLSTDNGFIISDHKPIQKEIKSENGIFSPKFGQSLSDMNPFIDRYKCECGRTRSRINNKIKCEYCGKPVKYVDDNFGYFGWLILNRYYIIHPNLYKDIEILCGPQKVINMLDIEDEKDEDGHSIGKGRVVEGKNKYSPRRKDIGPNEPFFGIGMVEFKKRFDEICLHYLNTSTVAAYPKKKEVYDHIMKYRDLVFAHSVPVFTTLLRPFEVSDKKNFSFEGTNGLYNMMSKCVHVINDESLKMNNKLKEKDSLLFNLQCKLNELYREIDNILSGKKGNVRQLAGGRLNFSSRDVIVQNPRLRIDEITLPYACLVELLQQQIVNILVKTYNMSYNDAYNKWYKANLEPDQTIVEIIKSLMFANNKRGIPIIINRNPSIQRGSLLQVFCVGMTMTYTMALSLQVLQLLAADFDGDVLNVFLIINEAFRLRAQQVLNPRNAMYISNNDGKCNTAVIPQRETLINSNTLVRLGRDSYTDEEIMEIKKCLMEQ